MTFSGVQKYPVIYICVRARVSFWKCTVKKFSKKVVKKFGALKISAYLCTNKPNHLKLKQVWKRKLQISTESPKSVALA